MLPGLQKCETDCIWICLFFWEGNRKDENIFIFAEKNLRNILALRGPGGVKTREDWELRVVGIQTKELRDFPPRNNHRRTGFSTICKREHLIVPRSVFIVIIELINNLSFMKIM